MTHLFYDVLKDAGAVCRQATERPVNAVTLDSRQANATTAFFACPGATPASRHGRDFLRQALAQGTPCVVAEPDDEVRDALAGTDVGWFETPRPRQVLAQAAEALFGHPSQKTNVIGVTGTNGKSTVTFLLASLLEAAGKRAAVFGTLGTGPVKNPEPSGFTTPEAEVLSARLAGLVKTGVSAVAMEVSSHALALSRIDGIRIAVAAFTNLSRDHLDFHETMEAYAAAKLKLFKERLGPGGVAVVPAGDTRFDDLPAGARRVTWATGGDADIVVSARGASSRGRTPIHVRIEGKAFDAEVPVAGRFNLENVAVAIGSARALGLSAERIEAALPHLITAPGRFEVIGDGSPTVIVDYAHTPDALTRVIAEARALTIADVWVVFGCGGDRDQGKRPLMGQGALGADHILVTDDNPRHEAADAIRAAILAGMGPDVRAMRDVREVARRSVAIATAIAAAGPGDVVVIAGKGHERTQTVGDVAHPFDDRAHARDALSARQRGEAS